MRGGAAGKGASITYFVRVNIAQGLRPGITSLVNVNAQPADLPTSTNIQASITDTSVVTLPSSQYPTPSITYPQQFSLTGGANTNATNISMVGTGSVPLGGLNIDTFKAMPTTNVAVFYVTNGTSGSGNSPAVPISSLLPAVQSDPNNVQTTWMQAGAHLAFDVYTTPLVPASYPSGGIYALTGTTPLSSGPNASLIDAAVATGITADIYVFVTYGVQNCNNGQCHNTSATTINFGNGIPSVNFISANPQGLSGMQPSAYLTQVIAHELGHAMGIGICQSGTPTPVTTPTGQIAYQCFINGSESTIDELSDYADPRRQYELMYYANPSGYTVTPIQGRIVNPIATP